MEQRKDQHKMRTTIPTLVLSIALMACGNNDGKETERVNDQLQENSKEMAKADDSQEWMKERDEALKELQDLRGRMEQRLSREEKRLADGIKDADRKRESQDHIAELKANIARLDAHIARIDGTDGLNWENLKRETRAATDTIGNWLDREIERIDRATKADADRDGH